MPHGSTVERSTIPGEPSPRWDRWERRLHVGAITLVAVIVLTSAVGLLGVRTGTVISSANGYALEVLYAEVSRPGLATPWSLQVSTIDGSALPPVVTVTLSTAYLAAFDVHGLNPTPSDSYSSGEWTFWEFQVPPGQSSLRVDLDGRLEPTLRWTISGSAAIGLEGESATSVYFTTIVIP